MKHLAGHPEGALAVCIEHVVAQTLSLTRNSEAGGKAKTAGIGADVHKRWKRHIKQNLASSHRI